MCSVSLLRHFEARKQTAAASCFMKLELRRQVPETRERAAKFRCSEVVMLLALSTLCFLASGAMAQVQESSTPILSSGLRNATPVQTRAIEKLGQSAAAESVFDPANLPSIESIGTGSDIRPFLASGVPADLTRAALRRAWSTDPAIRDFVGLSENSWDFNEPDSDRGFWFSGNERTWPALARTIEEAGSLDPARLAAERLTHDQVPAPPSEALQAPSSSEVK